MANLSLKILLFTCISYYCSSQSQNNNNNDYDLQIGGAGLDFATQQKVQELVLFEFTKTDRICPGTYWFCPYGCFTFSLIECLMACKNFDNSEGAYHLEDGGPMTSCTAVRYGETTQNEKCAFYFNNPWCYRNGATVDSSGKFSLYVKLDAKAGEYLPDKSGDEEEFHYFNSPPEVAPQGRQRFKLKSLKNYNRGFDQTEDVSSTQVAPIIGSDQQIEESPPSLEVLLANRTWVAEQYRPFNGTCFGQYWRCPYCTATEYDTRSVFHMPSGCMVECLREPRCGGFKFDSKKFYRCEMLLTLPKAVCLTGVADRSADSHYAEFLFTPQPLTWRNIQAKSANRSSPPDNYHRHRLAKARHNSASRTTIIAEDFFTTTPNQPLRDQEPPRLIIYLRKSLDVGQLVVL